MPKRIKYGAPDRTNIGVIPVFDKAPILIAPVQFVQPKRTKRHGDKFRRGNREILGLCYLLRSRVIRIIQFNPPVVGVKENLIVATKKLSWPIAFSV